MHIGILIKGWRYAERMGIREAAKILDVSPATLSRIENGKPTDSKTMLKMFRWLFGASAGEGKV